MAGFTKKNYSTVNKMTDSAEKDWSLTGCFKKSLKQATVELANGKSFQYASRWPFAEGDAVIVGNTISKMHERINQSSNSGKFGIVTGVEPKVTIDRDHGVELDFAFTSKVSKKVIKDCVKYLDMPVDWEALQNELFVETIFPTTFLIRRLLAAVSIVAHANIADAEEVERAKQYIAEEPDAFTVIAIAETGIPSHAPDCYLNDVHVHSDSIRKAKVELDGGYLSTEDYDNISKYSYIGAVSIMVRGGFVNLLKAFLSVNPPINKYYDEMIKCLSDTGNPEALDIIKNYK